MFSLLGNVTEKPKFEQSEINRIPGTSENMHQFNACMNQEELYTGTTRPLIKAKLTGF